MTPDSTRIASTYFWYKTRFSFEDSKEKRVSEVLALGKLETPKISAGDMHSGLMCGSQNVVLQRGLRDYFTLFLPTPNKGQNGLNMLYFCLLYVRNNPYNRE